MEEPKATLIEHEVNRIASGIEKQLTRFIRENREEELDKTAEDDDLMETDSKFENDKVN